MDLGKVQVCRSRSVPATQHDDLGPMTVCRISSAAPRRKRGGLLVVRPRAHPWRTSSSARSAAGSSANSSACSGFAGLVISAARLVVPCSGEAVERRVQAPERVQARCQPRVEQLHDLQCGAFALLGGACCRMPIYSAASAHRLGPPPRLRVRDRQHRWHFGSAASRRPYRDQRRPSHVSTYLPFRFMVVPDSGSTNFCLAPLCRRTPSTTPRHCD